MLCSVQICSVAAETQAYASTVADIQRCCNNMTDTAVTVLTASCLYPLCSYWQMPVPLLYLICISGLLWVCAIIMLAVTMVASNGSIASSLC